MPQLDSTAALVIAFLLLGVAGGMFIVPLNALIQFNSRDSELGTVLAGNNWVQNIVMLSFVGLTVLFALKGIDSIGLLYLALAACAETPEPTLALLSTPAAPEQAILQGVTEMGVTLDGLRVIHGSTVATNAVLEGKGVALCHTANHAAASALGEAVACGWPKRGLSRGLQGRFAAGSL